jgi:hypothetical protein
MGGHESFRIHVFSYSRYPFSRPANRHVLTFPFTGATPLISPVVSLIPATADNGQARQTHKLGNPIVVFSNWLHSQ